MFRVVMAWNDDHFKTNVPKIIIWLFIGNIQNFQRILIFYNELYKEKNCNFSCNVTTGVKAFNYVTFSVKFGSKKYFLYIKSSWN